MHEVMTWPNSQPSDETASDDDTWCEGYAQRSEETPSVRSTPRVRSWVRPAYLIWSGSENGCEPAGAKLASLSESTRRVAEDYAPRSPRPRSYKKGARVSGFFTLFHTNFFLSLKFFLSRRVLTPRKP